MSFYSQSAHRLPRLSAWHLSALWLPWNFEIDSNVCYVSIDRVMTDLLILGTLLAGPKHGYRLKQEAGLMFGQREIHNNLVYPLLRRFTANGWVRKKTIAGQRGQNRRMYSLTAAGRRALLSRISQFDEQQSKSADDFFIRVGFFELLSVASREEVLDRREAYLRNHTEHLRTLQASMQIGAFGPEVIKHIIQRSKAELAWIGRLRRKAVPPGSTKEE
jgi:DNA-binding PadR family transcriptional regulator